jgi:hypothetical protein
LDACSSRYLEGSNRTSEVADSLAAPVNSRLTNFLKFESRMESIGRRVRRIAIDLANDYMMGCSPSLLE